MRPLLTFYHAILFYTATKEAWTVYRQALRDITDQPDPFNIVWPEPPQ